MKPEEVKTGQRVRLTIDQSRFDDPTDLAYLLRQLGSPAEGLPPLDGGLYIVGGAFEAQLPEPHTMFTLHEVATTGQIVKVYLAEASELTLEDEA